MLPKSGGKLGENSISLRAEEGYNYVTTLSSPTQSTGVIWRMSEDPYNIRVTEIGEYIRHGSCQRRFKLGSDDELATEPPFAERLFNPLDPVLQEKGEEREDDWRRLLLDQGLIELNSDIETESDDDNLDFSDLSEAIEDLEEGQPAFAREVKLEDVEFNAFSLKGRMDFVLICWRDGNPYLRIVETKASRKDKTYHRIQVATYTLLLENLLTSSPIRINGNQIGPRDIEAVVGRIDEQSEEIQDILEMEAFDLSQEKADVQELTKESNGKLKDIVETDIDDLQYQLDSKCDSCRFDVHCFPESARQNRLEILGLNTSEIRVLREAGVQEVDDLADLDLDSPQASEVRSEQTFDADLETLTELAQARRQNLPGDAPDDEYELIPLSQSSESQLPEHEINGQRLVRVYLNVDYDYTENRIGSLAAHVTTSKGELNTEFEYENGGYQPKPGIVEEQGGRSHEVQGETIAKVAPSPWTGNYDADTGVERTVISGFFRELHKAIKRIANSESIPIHFYVWSESEIANLVEGCARAGGNLLSQLRQFLGCREPTEQLIYSSLQQEVDSRYALGWTSRGLVVATGVLWFGEAYHWTRMQDGSEVDFTHKFLQNLFDFRANLHLDDEGEWVDRGTLGSNEELFEIRSRFFDSLPAPYWRAHWRNLQDPDDVPDDDTKLRQALERYHRSTDLLEPYLKERTHALRWLDEQIGYKNGDIEKPNLDSGALLEHSLEVEGAADSALNFLDIDFHSKLTEWQAFAMQPPVQRVPSGDTIPVKNVRVGPDQVLRADLNLENHDISTESFKRRTSYSEGSFVRISPCFKNQRRGQTQPQLRKAGRTCVVESINWKTEQVKLDAIPSGKSDKFRLTSYYPGRNENLFEYATIDESVSDYTAKRVYETIQANGGSHAHSWFDPEELDIPAYNVPSSIETDEFDNVLENIQLPNGSELKESQRDAILDGIRSRVHLLHGPPGTGKTTVTAIATLLRVLGPLSEGDIALIGGNTHQAVTNLVEKINSSTENFRSVLDDLDLQIPEVEIVRIEDRNEVSVSEGVTTISPKGSVRDLEGISEGSVTLIGGTVNELLKLDDNVLSGSKTFGGDEREYYTKMLVVDEASMMKFPHFLSLAGSVDEQEGMILMAGDHRQLPPILSHDWEEEDRPPVETYQPYASAFEAVRQMEEEPRVTGDKVKMTALEYSFRLPAVVRELVSSAYNDDLDGSNPITETARREGTGPLERLWDREEGLYLIVHEEDQSRKSNEVETEIVSEIISAADSPKEDSIAVMAPHRAQRTLLEDKIQASEYEEIVETVDTVERMQGGECENVIVSATGSDQTAISDNEEFLLNLNRTNVAFSRTEQRLFVVCSRNLLNHIAPEFEDYRSSTLWKSLRELCDDRIGAREISETDVNVFQYSKQN